jgi:hypothetical protein
MELSESLIDNDKTRRKSFCEGCSDWVNTMTLLVENGADVTSTMDRSSKTPLQYLYPYWTRFDSESKLIKELFEKIANKVLPKRSSSTDYEWPRPCRDSGHSTGKMSFTLTSTTSTSPQRTAIRF